MSYTIHHGSNLDVLPTLPDNSIDAIVTDPPYELGFMGKKWDNSGIAYSVALWTECLRVLKPGGHLLSFGGTRTWHRVAVAIEDAGFDVRDSIAWMYGSGFPKSLDVSKAIDKSAGAEREVLTKTVDDLFGERQEESVVIRTGKEAGTYGSMTGVSPQTAPSTPEAEQWQGWGTALKPAFEPIIVARKPLIGTVAANVLEHGTGALNIDGSRIGTEGGTQGAGEGPQSQVYGNGLNGERGKPVEGLGRWPANVILDEYSAEILDEQSGVSKPRPERSGPRGGKLIHDGGWDKQNVGTWIADSGCGASRFFYVAKASKRDRNEGLEELPLRKSDQRSDTAAGLWAEMEAPKQNFHPTVKPTDLMRYLVKLVTPPNGVVLDPFTGSGSTGKAAILEGFDFIGIEMTDEYLPIIEGRLSHAVTMRAEQEAKKEEGLF